MRIRWSAFREVLEEFAAAAGSDLVLWVEDSHGRAVGGTEPAATRQWMFELEAGGHRLGAVHGDRDLGEPLDTLLRASLAREAAHQVTVADMADATARLWRQTNALLRMTASTDLAIQPTAMLERILGVLDHSTGLERGGGLVRLPGEGFYTCVGLEAPAKIDPEHVRALDRIPDDVRVVTDEEDDLEAMNECEALLHRRTPVAVAHLTTDSDDYGMLIVPVADAEEVRADDLKLLAAAAQILSVAIENTHTLSREREATRLAVENDMLNHQARDMEEMLHVVAHDLRSPMTALYGFVHVALESLDQLRERMEAMGRGELVGDSEPIAEPLENGVRSIEKLNRMVQRLLDFSRVARMDYKFEPLELSSLVRGVVESLGYQISERGIAVELEDLPDVVGDHVMLESVFRNLIDNAIKYMGDGELKAIRVGCYSEDGAPVYFVEDTGVGMDHDQVSKAFLPFRRFRTDAAPGEGIGLPYVRKIVERHGGRVWCESDPGVGTTFFFTLATGERDRAAS